MWNSLSTFQIQIALLENCLYSANSQHETEAEILELANCRGLSLEDLRKESLSLEQKLKKLIKLTHEIANKALNGELALLYIVKYNFLVKEVVETYADLLDKKLINVLTTTSVALYRKLNSFVNTEDPAKDAIHIILESSKHGLKALFENGLRINAFSESELSAFDLGDITPQESEPVLIFLSTRKKWEPVYKKLAAA